MKSLYTTQHRISKKKFDVFIRSVLSPNAFTDLAKKKLNSCSVHVSFLLRHLWPPFSDRALTKNGLSPPFIVITTP